MGEPETGQWAEHHTVPSGCLFEVAIITTPCSNSAVNNRFRIMASAISVTCSKGDKQLLLI